VTKAQSLTKTYQTLPSQTQADTNMLKSYTTKQPYTQQQQLHKMIKHKNKMYK